MEIQKETFEAWLFSQPDERTYDYGSTDDCLICKFIKETTSIKDPRAGGFYWRDNKDLMLPDAGKNVYPTWLLDFETYALTSSKTIGSVKQAWLKLFPADEGHKPLQVIEMSTDSVPVYTLLTV